MYPLAKGQSKGRTGHSDGARRRTGQACHDCEDGGGGTAGVAPGDVESRNRLVRENLGLVLPVARQHRNQGLTLEDLVGEGNLGLIRAAEDYDPTLGTRFSTYATYWIREAILAALSNTVGTIRLPMHVSKLLVRWRRTQRALRRAQGHSPTFEEVSAAMGLDPLMQRLVARAHCARGMLGDEDVTMEGGSWTFLELDGGARPEDELEAEEERALVLERLDRLDGRERGVVVLRYGLAGESPMSLSDIGRRLGMTPGAVQKIVSVAIWKLGGVHESRGAAQAPTYRNRVG